MTYHSRGFAEYSLTFKKKKIKTYLNANPSLRRTWSRRRIIESRNYGLDIGLDTGLDIGLDTGLDTGGGKSACLYATKG